MLEWFGCASCQHDDNNNNNDNAFVTNPNLFILQGPKDEAELWIRQKADPPWAEERFVNADVGVYARISDFSILRVSCNL
jgi:hypothetical protein